MKFIFILCISILFFAFFASGIQAKRTFGSCNCLTKATQKCSDNDRQQSCIRRYNRRCKRRCAYIKKTLPSCNCSTHAKKVCGTSASSEARTCRNEEISKCIKRFEEKLNVLIEKTQRSIDFKHHGDRKVTVHVPRRILRRYSIRVATKQCGSAETTEVRECRRKVRREVKERERTFRRNSLKACDCETKVLLKHSNTESRRYRKSLHRCRRTCLIKAIRIRAAQECSSKPEEKRARCERKHRRTYRSVHCPTATVNYHKRHSVHKRHFKRSLRRYSRRQAIKVCGSAETTEARECRRKVRREVKERERTFRRNSLKACDCETKVSLKHSDTESRRYRKSLKRCQHKCLIKAIRVRAAHECASKPEEKRARCERKHRTTYRSVHCPTVTVHYHKRHTHHKRHFKKSLGRYCKRQAIKVCGSEETTESRECRRKVRREVKERERTFRRNSLKACDCETKVELKHADTESRRYRKSLKRCQHKCLIKAIKVRAAHECASKPEEKRARCERKLRKTYRSVHCTTVKVQHHKKSSFHSRKFKKSLSTYCKRQAIKVCGSEEEEENKECRRNARKEIKEKEKKFRSHSLKACHCETDRCKTKCLKKAIDIRVKAECSDDDDCKTVLKTNLMSVHCVA